VENHGIRSDFYNTLTLHPVSKTILEYFTTLSDHT